MSRKFGRIAVVIFMAVMLLIPVAAQALSAGAVMTVSRTAQDAVVDEGDNFTIDVQIDGVEPALYRWYFNDEPIPDNSGRVYSIISAEPGDAGMYRVEAFADDGRMLMTMEFDLRVIDKALPKSGDGTLDAGTVAAVMTAGMAALAGVLIRRRLAA